jgi:hypothetical protein
MRGAENVGHLGQRERQKKPLPKHGTLEQEKASDLATSQHYSRPI